jgi:putative ABC transport system permease protein
MARTLRASYPETMAATIRDLRCALRLFARNPGFALVAVFTLAIGIGANTAIFSVADALLLRQLPYSQPDRLVLLDGQRKVANVNGGPLSWPRFLQVQGAQRSFSGLAAFTNETFNLTGRGDPAQVAAARVSWDFFDILGVHPALGRAFRPQEDRAGGDNVVLISHALWERHFASDPHVAGRPITLDSKDHTVIGVLPRGFEFALLGPNIDLYAPRVFDLNLLAPGQAQGGVMFLNFVGRLHPGLGIRQAQAEMDTLAAQYRQDNPKLPDADPGLTVRVANLQDQMVAGVRTAVLILFGAVGLVLLIACANVSSLLLSRALGRQREMAVRTAIGASRGGLIRQLLTESLLLALAGGILGAALSAWGTRVLAAMARNSLPLASAIHADGAVLAFALAVSVLAGILFGLAPALQVSRPDLNSVLRSEGRGATSGRRHNFFRNLLVVSQVALSMILLIAAGLLVRNLVRLSSASPGFDSSHLLTMNITLPPARYPQGPQMVAFFRELARQAATVPGVRLVAVSSALPVNPARFSPALPEGQPAVPLPERPVFNIQTLSPGYAATMRLPVRAGREFTDDDEQPPTVLLVNEALVRRFWPNQNPIGKHIVVGRALAPSEVVGVLADVRNTNLAADVQPEIFLPFARLPWASMNLLVRTAGDPHAFVSAVRQRVLVVDKDQPITQVLSMEEVLANGAAQPRFLTALLGALSGIALLLALVGIYGVIACSVTERTRELGIRMALGAPRAGILRLVVRQGLVLSLTGIAIGIAASLVLTRMLTTLLYRISPTDPATFAAGATLFAAVATLASYLPARRATQVDPVVALRED